MLAALERYFPQETGWTIPKGGLFLWVQLPDNLPIQAIRKQALAQDVLICCGSVFFPNRKGYPAMRLTFSNPLEDIDTGVAVLGKLLKSYISPQVKSKVPILSGEHFYYRGLA